MFIVEIIGFFLLKIKSIDWNCHQKKSFYLCEDSCLIGRLIFLLFVRCPFLHFFSICFLFSICTFRLKWEIFCYLSKNLNSHMWNKVICALTQRQDASLHLSLKIRNLNVWWSWKRTRSTAINIERSLKHIVNWTKQASNNSYSTNLFMFKKK